MPVRAQRIGVGEKNCTVGKLLRKPRKSLLSLSEWWPVNLGVKEKVSIKNSSSFLLLVLAAGRYQCFLYFTDIEIYKMEQIQGRKSPGQFRTVKYDKWEQKGRNVQNTSDYRSVELGLGLM
jgi:hypothetical protein